jgi:hypothetical protein
MKQACKDTISSQLDKSIAGGQKTDAVDYDGELVGYWVAHVRSNVSAVICIDANVKPSKKKSAAEAIKA